MTDSVKAPSSFNEHSLVVIESLYRRHSIRWRCGKRYRVSHRIRLFATNEPVENDEGEMVRVREHSEALYKTIEKISVDENEAGE